MAQGDVIVFDQTFLDLASKIHNISTGGDTVKMGIVDSTITPTATTADPRWGAGGTTDLSANEVATGTSYSAGGPALGSVTGGLSGGAFVFDSANVSIAQDATGFTDGRWAVAYNDTSSGKQVLFVVDLGGVVSIQGGSLNINANASGWFSINQA